MGGSVLEISLPNVPAGERPGEPFLGFLAGDENRLVAESIAHLFQGNQAPRGGERLLLVGGSGLGKSHLARGMAWKWNTCHVDDVVYFTSGTDFLHDFADSVSRGEAPAWRRRLLTFDLFVLDDVHALARRPVAQKELRLVLDRCDDSGKTAVLSSSTPVASLAGFDPGLKARLSAGIVLDLAPPSLETRLVLAGRIAALAGRKLNVASLRRIAETTETAEQIRGRLAALDAKPKQDSEEASEPPAPTLAEVVRCAAEEFGVGVAAVQGPSRRRTIALARHVASYLARRNTSHSLGAIGATLGGRDHTTVMHSVQTIERRVAEDADLQRRIDAVQRRLHRRRSERRASA